MSRSTQRVGVALGKALTPVGELLFETDGRRQTSLFRYAPEWLDRADSFPLAPNLPLAEMRFHQSGSRSNQRSALPEPMADGAPDACGRGLIQKAPPGGLTEPD